MSRACIPCRYTGYTSGESALLPKVCLIFMIPVSLRIWSRSIKAAQERQRDMEWLRAQTCGAGLCGFES